MSRSLQIPTYTSKDLPILVASMLPMSVLLNYFLYDEGYFGSSGTFLLATLTTFVVLGLAFLTYSFVAISLRNRFPAEAQLLKRMAICISIFVLMSAVYISLLLLSYDHFHFLGYEYSENDFGLAYTSFVVVNVFLTFLNEGIYRFERYRATITETEQLKKEYIQSQLLGLKSQMNPHFLFNSLNTLSSLINEDADKAEDFLDHMSKVYRYLLRNNDEQLVTVETELGFIHSYYHLLKARHAEGLQLHIDVPESHRSYMIPPLTLQMIVENAMSQNEVSKSNPLLISIHAVYEWLEVKNSVQPKMNNQDVFCEVIDNIANKFRLLCQQELIIRQNRRERIIQLPLITNKELVVA
ncbi:MAG TPA: histidine kinase [Flavisolibacter sp.]|nr:histidine kinase [Flavisolibacter sp.]